MSQHEKIGTPIEGEWKSVPCCKTCANPPQRSILSEYWIIELICFSATMVLSTLFINHYFFNINATRPEAGRNYVLSLEEHLNQELLALWTEGTAVTDEDVAKQLLTQRRAALLKLKVCDLCSNEACMKALTDLRSLDMNPYQHQEVLNFLDLYFQHTHTEHRWLRDNSLSIEDIKHKAAELKRKHWEAKKPH